MKSTRDPDLLIKAFLEEGIDELPDRSFDAVRTAIDQIRQWAVVGPWKEPQIMTATRFALIAAAIAVVAVVAIRFFPTTNVGPAPSPTPVVSASLNPTPAPTPKQLTLGDNGPLAGTYVTASPFPVRVTFTVPDGWTGSMGGPYAVFLARTNGPALSLLRFDTVSADPCHYDKGVLTPSPGPSVDDLVAALTSLPSVTSSVVSDTTIGGYPAKQLTLTAPATTAGCNFAPPDGGFRVWQLPLGGTLDMSPGETRRLWILDVNGQRLVIEGQERPGHEPDDLAVVQSVIDSMTISSAAN